MGRYRTRSTEVEAYEYTGDPSSPGWPARWLSRAHEFTERQGLLAFLCRGAKPVVVHKGDWVLKMPDGQFKTIDASSFHERYEALP